MQFILTGGSGFIGTHLTNLLSEQYPERKVWNFDMIEPGMPNPVVKNYKSALKKNQFVRSTFVMCDVREELPNPPFVPTPEDVIFHLAAVHRTPGHKDEEYFETNIKGAENVCAFAEKHGIKRIVFVSSIAPYGASEELKSETSLPMPNTPYGISKLVAEKTLLSWQKEDKDRKLLILRPGVVFGLGENGNFTRLYEGLKKRKFAYPGRKDTIKACIYVKELVRFILWNVESWKYEKTGFCKLYNCCYEPSYTIEQIVKKMLVVTDMNRIVPNMPNWLIMPIASFLGFLGSPMGICPARVKKLQISTNISGAKMLQSGYQFKYTLEEALQDWYADNDNRCLE